MHLDLKDKFHFSIDDICYSFMDLEFQKIKIHDQFCKEFNFTDGMLKGLLAEGRKAKEKKCLTSLLISG